MNDKVHMEVQMTSKTLFNYMITHSFLSLGGKIKWGVSIMCLILLPFSFFIADTTTTFVLFLIVFLQLGVQPLTLYASAKKQMLSNDFFKHIMKYTVSKEGVHVSDGGNLAAVFKWDNLSKIIETRKLLLFYISDTQAFIVPKIDIKPLEDMNSIKKIVKAYGGTLKYKFIK